MAVPNFFDYQSPFIQLTNAERTSFDWGLGAGVIPDKVLVLVTDAFLHAMWVGDGTTVGGVHASGFKFEGDGQLYKYDTTRTVWVSVSTEQFTFGHTNITSPPDFFRGPGAVAMTAATGYRIQRPSALVYYSWTAASYTTPVVKLYKGATEIYSHSPTANGGDLVINVALTTGEVINAKLDSGAFTNFIGVLHFKWTK